MDLFADLAPPGAANLPPPPPAAPLPPASAQPYGHLEHVGCRVVWHPGPITAGREWADLPLRIRATMISDFYRGLKVRRILAMPRNADRRVALERFRQLAGEVEARRVENMVREAWQARQAAPGAA